MNKILFLILVITSGYAIAQTEINVPDFNDQYCKTVKLLESGKEDIDYKKFRESFLKSEQFKVALGKTSELSELKKEMNKQKISRKYEDVLAITKQILSIDYTDLTAHKALRQTYSILRDLDKAKKYKTIQMGLLKSIINSGDGKSCETAWEVIQIKEEYFILKMLNAKLIHQKIY